MRAIKVLFLQSMMIASGIFFIVTIRSTIAHFTGDDIALPWYAMISIFLAGIFCSIPTLIWTNTDELDKKQFIARLILHFICVYVITMSIGCFFDWYDTIEGFVGTSCTYIIIYVFVWIVTSWVTRREDKAINKALDSIRDEE